MLCIKEKGKLLLKHVAFWIWKEYAAMMCKISLPDEEFKIMYIERNQMFDVHYHCKGIPQRDQRPIIER
jgi:hypothetical protein|tara:strand:- start:351 stop:557 length:207 start_codon:yes stop_codon:yes gene_type:complete